MRPSPVEFSSPPCSIIDLSEIDSHIKLHGNLHPNQIISNFPSDEVALEFMRNSKIIELSFGFKIPSTLMG